MTLSYEEGGECTRLTYAKFVKGEGEVEDTLAPPVNLTSTTSLPTTSNESNLLSGQTSTNNNSNQTSNTTTTTEKYV